METTKERNPYKDLEKILFRGFLEQKAEVEGLTFVFKSVSMKEIAEIELRCPMTGHPLYQKHFAEHFLAYSIFMLDGENLLSGSREENLKALGTSISEWDETFSGEVMSIIGDLNSRVANSYKLIEAYIYEETSRYYWRSLHDKMLNSFDVSGIHGTNSLPINEHQLLWTFYNLIEDQNQDFERQWSFTKFIASAWNPKGVKQIEDHDRTKKNRERERREEVRLKAKDPKAFENRRYVRQEARTREELQKQLLDWVQDRKDTHEIAMEEWEKNVAKQYFEKQERLKQRLEVTPEVIEDMKPEQITKLVPISQEQIKERLKQRLEERQNKLTKLVAPAILSNRKDQPKIFDYMEKENIEKARTIAKTAPEQAPKSPQVAPRYQQQVPQPQVNTAPSVNPRLSAMLGVPQNQPIQRTPPSVPSVPKQAQVPQAQPKVPNPGIDGKVIMDVNEIARRMKAKGITPPPLKGKK